ncbi:DUF5615 family PIN-like protein [Candidatus Obscuribacterales bacterium]|nr:DUF5615 family PIN-like protein [Candidatus Obscuribacterales bacterium]MBX3152224.1 DUF5615 family PIN-like protein [Candidatus Obscuribacterales bacterium]
MSLKLLLDEDSQDKILVAKLKNAGHDVVTAKDAGLLGQPDRFILAYAVANMRVVVTRNCADFCEEAAALKSAGEHHYGILLRYEKNDPEKDMTYDDIVRAIGNIDTAVKTNEIVLFDSEVSLSYYRY